MKVDLFLDLVRGSRRTFGDSQMVQGNLDIDHKLGCYNHHQNLSVIIFTIKKQHHENHNHDGHLRQETMVLDGSDRRRMEEFGKKHLLLLGSMDRHGQSYHHEDDDGAHDDNHHLTTVMNHDHVLQISGTTPALRRTASAASEPLSPSVEDLNPRRW